MKRSHVREFVIRKLLQVVYEMLGCVGCALPPHGFRICLDIFQQLKCYVKILTVRKWHLYWVNKKWG